MMNSDPKGTVEIRNGRVVYLEKITRVNGEPFPTITITRDGSGFRVQAGDQRGGGVNRAASLQEAMQGFHPAVVSEYSRIFDLTEVTRDSDEPSELRGYYVFFL